MTHNLKKYIKTNHASIFILLTSVFNILNLKLHFLKLTQTNFVYKYLPKIFLFSKFKLTKNINSEIYWDNKYSNKKVDQNEKLLSKNIYKILKKNIDFKNKSLIDIGCGDGTFLKTIDVDCDLYGADISNSVLKDINEKKITTYKIMLPEIKIEKKFDIITSFETLEHISDWKKSISNIFNILKPDGFFCLTVPFKDSIVIREHVNYFDLERLYSFFKFKKKYVAEIKILGSWILFIVINRSHDQRNDKIISFFK
jgi:2-polyprenyl-3-methyl-5-hydroxy-6-metoxy-1,4-benzoquinol methylase